MDEEEKECFSELITSIKELKEVIISKKNETIEDLKFFKVPFIAKILHKNKDDTRKLMRSKRFSICTGRKGRC